MPTEVLVGPALGTPDLGQLIGCADLLKQPQDAARPSPRHVIEPRWRHGRSGTPAARTSTELRALFSSLRTSPPITTGPAGAPGCDPTTIRSTGSARDSRTVAPSFAASALAVSRATSLVGPARGTAIDLIAPSNCVRRPAAAIATATEPPSRRCSADVPGST